jgi:nucleoside-diphosphate-sugar epimerase
MIVFITGATGALGKPVCQHLVKHGHQVRALSRSTANDAVIKHLGGEPVKANLFDVESLREGIKGANAILHLATKIPATQRIGRQRAWRENDAIRREGTRNLVDAALEHNTQVFVYPSIVFSYPDRGDAWIDETTRPELKSLGLSTLEAEAEVTRFANSGRRGITLRMGAFYHPSSPQIQEMVSYARKGISPLFGRDTAYQPFIWTDDAAQAVVSALLEAPSGIFNVVDDEPLTKGELRLVIAGSLNTPKLRRVPNFVTSLFLGVTADPMMRSQRVSNHQFKAVTNWKPKVPNAREGWKRIGKELA